MRSPVSVVILTLFLFGCASADLPPAATAPAATTQSASQFISVPELKELMATKVELDAEVIWNASLDETAPKTDADWQALDQAAARLAEAGAALMNPPLAKDEAVWKEEAQKLIEFAELCRQAIKEKNREALIDAGNKMTEDSCTSCHKTYYNPA